MKPQFEPLDDGLEIIDPIERHRYRLTTHEPVDPEPVDTDRIQFPVATAVEITTEMITLPTNESVYVRDEDGEMIAEVRPNKQSSLPSGTYTLDLSGPLKVYARVESHVYIYSDSERTYITLDEATRTTLGARSYHRRPAGTITTTVEPSDLMKTVSAFGSALKSTTPERSYPTHRGHPPAVELGNELNIPEEFERPDTGIQIEVPPLLRSIFVITPLAYYLGARVVSGEEPLLVTETGFSYELGEGKGLESTVERVLKQIFFFDCLVRTEGSTPLPLYERQVLEPKLDFNIETVYEQELTKQIETYLSVPFNVIDDSLPEWRLETYLDPTSDSIEFLPFLTRDLSIIKVGRDQSKAKEKTSKQTQAVKDFTRNDSLRRTGPVRDREPISMPIEDPESKRIRQNWRSEESQDIICEIPLSAYQNSINRTAKDDPIEIAVVCNENSMEKELESVNEVYGNRKEIPFDVSVYHGLRTNELKSILRDNLDFVHFIGHIDENGFKCSNGYLDISDFDRVGPKAFFLNACKSHDQGVQLVESGSIGGIVTLDEVVNSGAVKMGGLIARLLNRGFPLYAALDIARKESVVGGQYFVVGEGMTTITQSETEPLLFCSINCEDDQLSIQLQTYLKNWLHKGGVFTPYLEGVDAYFLIPNHMGTFSPSREKVERFLKMGDFPVITDGEVNWSQEICIDEL